MTQALSRGWALDPPLPNAPTPPPLPDYLPSHPLVVGSPKWINRFICRVVDTHMYAIMDLDIPNRFSSFICTRCSRTLVTNFPASTLFRSPQAHQE